MRHESLPEGVRLPAEFNPRRDPPLDFPARDLNEMTPGDYDVLGFMCGLEVHQQLRTVSKLFCRCPAGHSVTAFDAEVLRHMRPTLSELGEYDGTALMEFKTRKDIVYRLERGTVCTYEMDDTPPFEIDAEAVRIALDLCVMLDLNLVSELHVMRKQYLDGSIPTGFQRTAMMGLGGAVPFRAPQLGVDKMLRIRQLSLEEDACREVSDIGHRITFRTDRLGMPLTEVVTEPDLLTPWEVQAGARLVARATRAIGRVRRGPGAARQDVNVSIAGGRRVEIKGVHHHRGLPQLVHIEAFRQLNLLRLRAELLQRGVRRESLIIPGGIPWEVSHLVVDATSILKRSNYAPLRAALDDTASARPTTQPGAAKAQRRRSEAAACAVRLPGFAGLLVRPTQPGVTFANELADRVRVIACLTAQPFMIHSDIKGYGLTSSEWRQLRSTLQAEHGDSVIVVWGPRDDCATAARELFLRAAEALDGIPAETRQAYRDGTNGFERILPGPDRMYPDTDTPPMPVPDAWIAAARARVPERPWNRAARYVELGLTQIEAEQLLDAPWSTFFDRILTAASASLQQPLPALTTRRLFYALAKQMPGYLRRCTGSRRAAHQESASDAPETAYPPVEPVAAVVRATASGENRHAALDHGLARLLVTPSVDAPELVASYRARPGDDRTQRDLVRRYARDVIERRRPRGGLARDSVLRWAMGEIMPALRGRVDAHAVRGQLEKAIEHVPQVEGVAEP